MCKYLFASDYDCKKQLCGSRSHRLSSELSGVTAGWGEGAKCLQTGKNEDSEKEKKKGKGDEKKERKERKEEGKKEIFTEKIPSL